MINLLLSDQLNKMQGKIKKSVSKEKFKRFEFNHPLNPFRTTSDKSRMHLKHLYAKDINRGVVNSFRELLKELQQVLKSETKDIESVSTLTSKLYSELDTFSKMPCTSNINTSIFEHLNHILQLLYDWQGYGAILQKMQEDFPGFSEKVKQEFNFSQEDITQKINSLKEHFIKLTKAILSEIKIIQEEIDEEQKE